MEKGGICAAVVSFPRSGTHLTIDFLRRNFAEFAFMPRFWQSSRTLYYNLDIRSIEEEFTALCRSVGGMPRKDMDHHQAAARRNFIVKTHDLPFDPERLTVKLDAVAGARERVLLYPFRRAAKVVPSYHAMVSPDELLEAYFNGEDRFLCAGMSVREALLHHGEWGLANAVPLDVEDLRARPSVYVSSLAARFGWTALANKEPVPPKRLAAGSVGGAIERLRRRRSSEVVVKVPKRPAAETAFLELDDELAGLYRRLKARAAELVA